MGHLRGISCRVDRGKGVRCEGEVDDGANVATHTKLVSFLIQLRDLHVLGRQWGRNPRISCLVLSLALMIGNVEKW